MPTYAMLDICTEPDVVCAWTISKPLNLLSPLHAVKPLAPTVSGGLFGGEYGHPPTSRAGL
jgi:hypothetical protein